MAPPNRCIGVGGQQLWLVTITPTTLDRGRPRPCCRNPEARLNPSKPLNLPRRGRIAEHAPDAAKQEPFAVVLRRRVGPLGPRPAPLNHPAIAVIADHILKLRATAAPSLMASGREVLGRDDAWRSAGDARRGTGRRRSDGTKLVTSISRSHDSRRNLYGSGDIEMNAGQPARRRGSSTPRSSGGQSHVHLPAAHRALSFDRRADGPRPPSDTPGGDSGALRAVPKSSGWFR